MCALNVAIRASVPAAAALNQNQPPSPDSAMTVLAIEIIELIVDSAAHFAIAPWAYLNDFRLPLVQRNPGFPEIYFH